MSSFAQSPSVNSSVTSSHIDSFEDKSSNVKKYVRDILRSRIFLGRYIERRFVNQIIGYRDIVLISAAETELMRDFLETVQKLSLVLPNSYWIGITNSEALGLNVSPSLCLWTEIDNEPFGPFWFQIKTIKFRENEVLISVKSVRQISEAFLELEPILTGAAKKTVKAKTLCENTACSNGSLSDIKDTLKSVLSIRNVKEFLTLIFAFVIAIFTGSTAFVNFLGNFILALLRELSMLMKNSTPMFLGILDFLSKIVGGFYILMAMFFKPSNPNPRNKRNLINYNAVEQYNPRQFD